jgi:basic membrane protein A
MAVNEGGGGMRRKLRLLAPLMALAMVGAACAEEDGGGVTPTGGGTGALPGAGMKACYVSDTGGIDDKSFNQTSWDGVLMAQAELGVEPQFLESQTQDDYAPNIQTFIDDDCAIIITAGFLLGDQTQAAAEANPDQPFTIIDVAYDPPIPNVLGQTYRTDEAGFMAGYVAAAVSQTGTIATYGGINVGCGVTCFMDGYWMGARYHNQQKGTNVEVLGWDAVAQDGTFTGDFENQDRGRGFTEDFISEGADIILPVAGPVGLGTIAAVQDSSADDKVIWVDVDGCVSVEESCAVILTTIQKNIEEAVFLAIQSVIEGNFQGGTNYTGTLENGGVGLAPFHEFEAVVPDDVKQEIEQIQQQIISGELSLDPADYA